MKLLKTNDKIPKVDRETKAHYIQRNKDMDDSRFLVRNNLIMKAVEQHL